MPQLCDRSQCTGCGACANACPKGCIRMTADMEGFLYPQIDTTECVQCGLCESACPVISFEKEKQQPFPMAFGVHNHDEQVVSASSSGGVFTALAQSVIEQGGVVYGAAFQEDFSVAHRRVDSVNDLSAFRGSKYAQSNVGSSYRQVKADLKNNKKVLFSGTPCQVAALRSFLGKDDGELLCVDIICHSVPSPKVWQTYLRNIEEKSGKKVIHANFRDKRDSWQAYYLCTRLTDGSEDCRRGNDNHYMRAFIQGLSTRPSCYSCRFKGQNRGGDITLGDFWGVETICPEVFHKEGTSLVLVQSEKGQAAFERALPKLQSSQLDAAKALMGNPAYFNASVPHRNREKFFRHLDIMPFAVLTERMLAPGASEILRQRISGSVIGDMIRKLCALKG